jgi:hypothetical protein
MNKLILALPLVVLCGCAQLPPKIVDHNVMVPVPCKVTPPVKPVMPLSDTGSTSDDIFVKVKKALAEIDVRKGYEAELEAAVGSCK